MVFRPRDLASRMAGRRKPDDGYMRETFTLPRDKARARARDFLNRYPKAAYMSAVDSWRELPGGEAFRAEMNRIDDCRAQLAAVRDWFAQLAEQHKTLPRITAPAANDDLIELSA